ncbi:MAG TPA: hypothetical protein VH187_22340 [Scandinavium sp.]|uniref:hypothetical protein n=1 Tax=Scandinavium sp. TaxID=2830653 RepID=UPI002E31759F|nr:hypothetical protein [Scandinavium sp.]HEX4503875.1 hypothetical protein [Scandinavium sp.]
MTYMDPFVPYEPVNSLREVTMEYSQKIDGAIRITIPVQQQDRSVDWGDGTPASTIHAGDTSSIHNYTDHHDDESYTIKLHVDDKDIEMVVTF